MNELYCSGCGVYFKTDAQSIGKAMDELAELCFSVGIEICLEGYMRLTDKNDKVLEEC